MPDFVCDQECLFEWRPTVLVKNQWYLAVVSGPASIEESCARSARLYGDAELVGDCDRELIRRPRIEPSLDCLMMQRQSVLSSQLYSVHDYSLWSSFDRAASSIPASRSTLSNDTFSASVGLTLDLFARSWDT